MPKSPNLIKAYSLNLGDHRGNKRVWIESKRISETELANDMSYLPVYDKKNKRVSLVQGKERKITARSNGRSVIDLNNNTITEMFDGHTQVIVKIATDSIIIEPLEEEVKQREARSKATASAPTFLEVFAGGGTLIRSLKDAGLTPVGAVELEDKYLENTEANNPDIFTYCGDLAKLDVSLLPRADIVSGGIPCEGYSQSQLGTKKQESHPTGSLGFYFLKIVDTIRPAMVLIEEVPNFGNSAMAAMAKYVLSSMGYSISEQVLCGSDYGSLTKRKRYVMVASIKDKFDFERVEKSVCTKTVADILEIPMDEREWHTAESNASVATMLRREVEHRAKGNGFSMGRAYPSDTTVATITKGHYKIRLTDPILAHPDSEHYSFFTPRELANINGLPRDFILPDVKVTAGEIIGQGVCYEAFYALGKEIKKHFSLSGVEVGEAVVANNSQYRTEELKAFSAGVLFLA